MFLTEQLALFKQTQPIFIAHSANKQEHAPHLFKISKYHFVCTASQTVSISQRFFSRLCGGENINYVVVVQTANASTFNR